MSSLPIPAHRIATILMALLIVIVLIQGGVFIKQTIKKSTTPVHSVVGASDTSRQLISSIPEWHLFGVAPIVQANLAETHLQLDLNGVMTGKNKENTFAIIGEPGKDQKLYRAGDGLPGGAVLYQIDPYGVVIQYNGELQRLPLLKPTGAGTSVFGLPISP